MFDGSFRDLSRLKIFSVSLDLNDLIIWRFNKPSRQTLRRESPPQFFQSPPTSIDRLSAGAHRDEQSQRPALRLYPVVAARGIPNPQPHRSIQSPSSFLTTQRSSATWSLRSCPSKHGLLCRRPSECCRCSPDGPALWLRSKVKQQRFAAS